jgi:hypothetical protein
MYRNVINHVQHVIFATCFEHMVIFGVQDTGQYMLREATRSKA